MGVESPDGLREEALFSPSALAWPCRGGGLAGGQPLKRFAVGLATVLDNIPGFGHAPFDANVLQVV